MNCILRLMLLALLTTPGFAQMPVPVTNTPAARQETANAATAASSSLQAVSKAREVVSLDPNNANAYAALGLALCHRGQQTSDGNLYAQADEALTRALQIVPNNFEAEKAQVCVELGRHEFARARSLAMILNKRIPDDVMVYGLLVDANSALGNYSEAENAAQWMLNLRPGNTPAFLQAADLREVFGEPEGGLQLLKIVLDTTSPTDVEGRVRVLTQMAQVNLEMGNLSVADSMSEQALSLQPGDSRALLVRAQVRLLQGNPTNAVQLLRQAYKAAPKTGTMYALAEAMEAAGMEQEAQSMFSDFERQAQEESFQADNANRQLIFYYADHAKDPAKALKVAEREIAGRHDVYTLDAYAWALHKNGRDAEAKIQMDMVLKVGIREASIFYHAGQIELQLGNRMQAEHHLREAAKLNSISSQAANLALTKLQSQTNIAR